MTKHRQCIILKAKENITIIYFVLMIVAKAAGLHSGNKLYILISAFAVLLAGIVILTTEYTKRERIIGGIVLILAIISTLITRNYGIILSVISLCCIKDLDMERLWNITLKVFSITMIITIICSLLGILPNNIIIEQRRLPEREVIRYAFAYIHPNQLHLYFFVIVAIVLKKFYRKINLKLTLGLMVANFFVFELTNSRSGFAVTLALIIAFFILKKMLHQRLICNKRSRICAIASIVYLLAITCGSIIIVLLYDKGIGWIEFVDKYIVTDRIHWAFQFYNKVGFSIIGQNLAEASKVIQAVIDNTYCYLSINYGIVWLLLFICGYGIAIVNCCKKKRFEDVLFMLVFLTYGITEQFLTNCFVNYSLFIVGQNLFELSREYEVKKQEKKILSL